jgi:potassium/chloride transporter 9
LLENLRIEATVLVFWLACGDIKSYNLVVNGQDVEEEALDQVNKVLEDELWWRELQTVRGRASGDASAADALSITDDIAWSSSFPGKRDNSMIRYEGLRKILQHPKKRPSFGNLSSLGVSLTMRTHRLDDDMMSRHVSHPSDSEASYSEEEEDGEDGFESDFDVSGEDEGNTASGSSARKTISQKGSRASSKRSNQKAKRDLTASRDFAGSPEPMIQFDEDILLDSSNDETRGRKSAILNSINDVHDSSSPISSLRNSLKESMRNEHGRFNGSQRSGTTSVNFTSSPVPPTEIAEEEGAGPSIMFADPPRPRRESKPPDDPGRSIYARKRDDSDPAITKAANGFPAAASVQLSFNDLPSRAQHMILNELISQHSDDTAVIFTTLPAPVEGTYRSETDSLSYVSDLEVLVGGLPPTLLVHSNSMTVTTNL